MARRSHLKGARKVKRILRALPDTMRAEMVHVMQDSGPKIARAMQARTPVRSGELRAGLTWKVFPRTLRLQVGLLGTKRGRAKLFYGWILNFGRKAKVVTAKRGGTTYQMRIRAFTGLQFVTGRYRDLRADLNRRLREVWGRVLRRAAAGGGDE